MDERSSSVDIDGILFIIIIILGKNRNNRRLRERFSFCFLFSSGPFVNWPLSLSLYLSLSWYLWDILLLAFCRNIIVTCKRCLSYAPIICFFCLNCNEVVTVNHNANNCAVQWQDRLLKVRAWVTFCV